MYIRIQFCWKGWYVHLFVLLAHDSRAVLIILAAALNVNAPADRASDSCFISDFLVGQTPPPQASHRGSLDSTEHSTSRGGESLNFRSVWTISSIQSSNNGCMLASPPHNLEKPEATRTTLSCAGGRASIYPLPLLPNANRFVYRPGKILLIHQGRPEREWFELRNRTAVAYVRSLLRQHVRLR